jgi:hypothetical protein
MRFRITALALATGCSGADSEPTRHTLSDRGSLCLESTVPAEQQSALRVTVLFDTCLSPSCDVNRTATRNVEVAGAEIHVTSRKEWESSSDTPCTADCGFLIVGAKESKAVPNSAKSARRGIRHNTTTTISFAGSAPTHLELRAILSSSGAATAPVLCCVRVRVMGASPVRDPARLSDIRSLSPCRCGSIVAATHFPQSPPSVAPSCRRCRPVVFLYVSG